MATDVQLHFEPPLSICTKMTLCFFKMWNVGFYTSPLNFNVIYLIMLMKFSKDFQTEEVDEPDTADSALVSMVNGDSSSTL